MSTHPMPGFFTSAFAPGYGSRSHSSDTQRPEIGRSMARSKAYFTRQAHKAARRAGHLDLSTEVRDWREESQALELEAVDAWFTSLIETCDPEYSNGTTRANHETDHETDHETAYSTSTGETSRCSSYEGFDWYDDAQPTDAIEEWEAEFDRLLLDPTAPDFHQRQQQLLDPEYGTFREGLHPDLSRLGYASAVTLEEANFEGLRVTNRPSGYTYGRS